MTREEKLNAAQEALLKGDTHTAESLYQDVLRGDSSNLRALDGMGILQCSEGNAAKGLEYFHEALREIGGEISNCMQEDERLNLTQSQATLLFHAGLALRSLARSAEALNAFHESCRLYPHTPEVFLNLGQIYFEQDEYENASACFHNLVAMQPENASAWLTLGYIYSLRNNHGEAVKALEEAVRLDPASPDACFFLAESLRKEERYEESLPHYRRMLQVGAEWPQAVHGYGKSLLALGYLEDGWDAMEFRLASTFGTWERHNLPAWDGAVDESKTVLAYSEEGIGAEILFASCIPDLVNSVGCCVVECEQSLHGLFARSFPRTTLVPLAQDTIGPDNPWGLSLDAQVAMGSLPRHFRHSMASFPLRKGYLVPDRDRVEKWSNRLAEIGGVAKVGVLWHGTWTAETKEQVSLPMPELRNLMLRHQADAAWVCLQHGSKQKEIDQYRRGVSLQLRLYPEAFQYDLDEMAALVAALDLVVTPPGFVAHLAGALGVKTWLVLPAKADWRWNLGNPDCLWHTTVQMYRQKTGQAWSEVFRTLGGDLDKFLSTYRSPEEGMPVTLEFPVRHAERLSTATRRAG